MRTWVVRRTVVLSSVIVTAGLVTLAASGPLTAEEKPGHPTYGLESAAGHVTAGPAQTAKMKTNNFTVVGHSDLGGTGMNADIWVHLGYAYVGVWSGPCLASGVKVADVRDPHSPRVVGNLANPANTSAEDVVVRHVDTPSFTGELAVVGIQTCGDPARNPAFRGLELFDVTDPTKPRELSRYSVHADTRGCHEVDLAVRSDGSVLAACSNEFAEQIVGSDEAIVVDVTDPYQPVKVGGFALGKDLGVDPGRNHDNVGCIPASFGHSVRFTDAGQTLFVSFWDYGTLRFDVTPSGELSSLIGRTDIAPPDEDGDNHSMTLAKAGHTMVVNPEDFSPIDCGQPYAGWGEPQVYTNHAGRNQLLSTFSTPNSRSMRTDGFYSIHNTEVAGSQRAQLFSSWYTDGVVWWSIENRRDPVGEGQFVPPPTEDPTGYFPPVPIVWGVYPDPASNLIFASDINSGLWILRPTGLGDF